MSILKPICEYFNLVKNITDDIKIFLLELTT